MLFLYVCFFATKAQKHQISQDKYQGKVKITEYNQEEKAFVPLWQLSCPA
jgi:hypothetical protein